MTSTTFLRRVILAMMAVLSIAQAVEIHGRGSVEIGSNGNAENQNNKLMRSKTNSKQIMQCTDAHQN